MTSRFPTALIGFGKMGWGYTADPAMARHYRYAAHAQVLGEHPAFEWRAVVDPDPAARAAAAQAGIGATAQAVEALPAPETIEVAVIATPPESRLSIIDKLPRLRAVLVEKPLGTSLAASRAFLAACAARGILVQVNLWRRADERLRDLASGGLQSLIGDLQLAVGWYGNGLLNNGTHAVDLARMLFGEVTAVQRVGLAKPFVEGPIAGDTNPTFALSMAGGLTATFHPLRFTDYRENGLSIWGRKGRLDFFNEGLTLHHFPVCDNRAMSDEHEVAADAPRKIASTVGVALYRMYDNLADALTGGASLWSSGQSALTTSMVIEAVQCANADGRALLVDAKP